MFVMPQNVSVSDGQSVTFMCVVDLAGSYELQWSHNGEVLLGENQSLLTVSDVTAAQGGNYTCSVVNVVGRGMDTGTLYGKCDANHYLFITFNWDPYVVKTTGKFDLLEIVWECIEF